MVLPGPLGGARGGQGDAGPPGGIVIMAFSPVAAVGPRDSLGAFICPICLEVFTAPWDTGCGHTFCEACLHRCLSTQQPQCAVCRSPLAARDARRNEAVERTMAEMLAPCSACSEKVRVSDFRAHTSTCAQAQKAQIAFQTPTTTAASLGPNRFTFMCPYCGTRNLDQDDLLRHCIERHHSDRTRVVCPVCASMPWGDPNYCSSNFIQHLTHRHRFSYDTYVDYQADDDSTLQEVLQRSLQEK
ncbi:unnamed protein product [Lampetra planeri]